MLLTLPKRVLLSLISPLFFSSVSTYADTITWQECSDDINPSFDCATFYVPLDYQNYENYDKESGYIGIEMIKLPARDQAHKKGTIFFNPGGPGGSGFDFVHFAGPALFNEAVREHYDFVGFDPRGIGRSAQLRCFDSYEEIDYLNALPAFPTNMAEVALQQYVDQGVSDLCLLRASDIIDHMSTADVARDMDAMRLAVGDEKLNYFGVSYGTYLGVVYANLFPDNVGAMIVDGVLDPVGWSRGRGHQSAFLPFSSRIKSAKGAQGSLQEFFRTCDEGGLDVCDLAGNAQARFYAVLEVLKQGPVPILEDDGSIFYLDYARVVSYTLSVLYNPESWQNFAELVASLEFIVNPDVLSEQFSALRLAIGESEEEAPRFQPLVGFAGVACADSDNPGDYENWVYAAEYDEARFGIFGPAWSWASSICHSWPGAKASRYEGGFRVKTANPVLVINTLFDPATPYHGAKKVNRLLKNSRLVTVNGWGHGSILNSQCVTDIEADYLLTGTLPDKGTVCDQNEAPFGASFPLGEDERMTHNTKPVLSSNLTKQEKVQRRKVLREIRRKALREMRGK